MDITTTARYSTFIRANLAARKAGGCRGCANLAAVGVLAQCNHHRVNSPDDLTRYATMYAQAYALGCTNEDSLVNAVLDTLKVA